MKLTDRQCLNAKRSDKPYQLRDGHGLYLEIHPNGSKYWRMEYSHQNKRGRLAFGTYPEVSLLEAREKRAAARKLMRNGINPSQHKKTQTHPTQFDKENTFEAIAREWHQQNLEKWTPNHAKDILRRFELDIFSELGDVPITELETPDILVCIRNIENRGARELAKRGLQNIGRVCRFAIATGRAKYDPTFKMSEALKAKTTKHHKALDLKDIPEFMTALRENKARLYPITLYATELLLLTFVRTGELIGAKWSEFNFEKAEWVIPASRMKMRNEHIVPLSDRTLVLLNKLKDISGNREYVFPHFSNPRKHMSNNTVLKAIDRLGFKDKTTGHGFRATAMSTIKQELGYRHEVVDRQLAHAPKNQIDAAYDRAEFLSERRIMMQNWANYLENLTRK